MASQKMRLEAEMKDAASPAIRKLREELRALQAETAESRGLNKLNKEIANLRKEAGDVRTTPGMKAFGAWMDEAGGKAKGFAGSIKDIPGILGALGLGGIAAGASVASLAGEMKRLGEQALAMKEVSRQTEMSLDFVNRWSHAGEHFAVTGDAMTAMLDRFAGQLPDFNRATGSMYKEFSQWPDVIRRMQHEGPAEALKDAFRQAEEVGRTKGPQVRKQFLDAIGLGGDAEKLFGENGLAGFFAQLDKPWAGPSAEFMEGAKTLRDATSGFNNELTRFENTTGPAFLKTMTGLVEGAAAIVRYLGQPAWTDKEKADRQKTVEDWKSHGAKPEENPFANGQLSLIPKPKPPSVGGWKEWLFGSETPAHPSGGKAPPWLHKSSYDGSSAGLFHNAAFTTGGDTASSSQFGLRGIMTDATKAGVVAAFREMMIDRAATDSAEGDGAAGGHRGSGGSESGSGGRRGFALGEGGGTGSASAGHMAANNAELMRAAQEQLLKEGVSPDHVKAAAAALVGNVVQESGGDPNKVHDGGTGYGLYGARLGRRDNMLAWLVQNGFARNSAEGQMKYMAHEAMTTKEYANTAAALRLAQQSNLGAVTDTIAKNFERPNAGAANYGGRRNNAAAAFGSDIGGGAGASGAGAAGDAVDRGMSLLGKNGAAVGKAFGVHITPGEWCAEFVNGALKASGIKGTNSAMAGSFSKWGKEVGAAGVKKGDVVVDGEPAGHVSLATGATRMKNGHLQIETLNGNWGHSHGESAVKKDWLTAQDWVHVRRAEGLPTVADARHPSAGRRAGTLGDASRAPQDGSDHRLTIAFHDPAGHVKSTRLERNGPLKVEMPNHFQTGRNALIGA